MLGWLIAPILLGLFLLPSSLEAVEYRLRVASVQEPAYFHFADRDGALPDSPFSLNRLKSALDRGEVPSGVFVSSRDLVPATAGTARSFDAVVVRPAGELREEGQWQEVRWEGKPGERVVWVVQGQGVHLQEVTGVGFMAGGNGQLRHYIPHGASLSAASTRATRFPLALIESWEGRPGLWQKWLARYVDLREGIAAVIGQNRNPVFADSVFLVIQQGSAPATYTTAIAWRNREPTRTNQWEGALGGADPSVH